MSDPRTVCKTLLGMARQRLLTQTEAGQMMQLLRDADDDEQREDAIQALGLGGVRGAAEMVAGFLDNGHSPGVREMAIRCLTEWMDRADLALAVIKQLIVEWEEDDLLGGIRLAALHAAGPTYQQTQDIQLVGLLLDAAYSSIGPPREAALASLLVIVTLDWGDLTPGERENLRDQSSDAAILARASALQAGC